MKFEKNPKYNTNAFLVLLAFVFAAVIVSLVLNFGEVSATFGTLLSVLAPIVSAFVIVLVLLPAVNFFEGKFEQLLKNQKNSRKKAKVLAVLCTYLLLFLVVGLVIWIVISQLARAYDFVAKFADEYFPILNRIIGEVSEKDGVIGEYLSAAAKGLKDAANSWVKSVPNFAKAIAGVLSSTVTRVSDIVLGIIISIYALFRRTKLKVMFRKINVALFPENASARIARFFGDLYRNLGAFLSSRAYNTVVLAVVLYLVLLAMGLEFYSLIALTVAVCSFVPVVGIVVGGGIGTFMVLVTNTDKTVWFVAVLLILAILDYVYLRPLITNKRVRVSLGTTIICVFLGFFVGRLLGAIVALPLYITVRDIVFDWYAKKKEKETV